MIIQQTLKHPNLDAEREYLDGTISALNTAMLSGDPTGKIAEALQNLTARREELRPQVQAYDQRLHG